MATYKIIQDIEAEDKIIGPLTMKQLLFGLLSIAAIAGSIYLGNRITGFYSILIITLGLVMGLPLGFLALPLRRDQPNEVWLMAHLNFRIRPKTRLWSQLGNSYQGVVFQDDPVVLQDISSSQYSPNEIESRVQDLSSILDSSQTPENTGQYDYAYDDEQEVAESQLDNHFQQLLSSHHVSKKQNFFQGLKTRLTQPQTFNVHQVIDQEIQSLSQAKIDIMKSTTQAEDLKISTLATLANNPRIQKSS